MIKGKSAVVTGSTSGIGLGIAQALAEAGANVTINGFGDKAAIETERAGPVLIRVPAQARTKPDGQCLSYPRP